MKDLKLIDLAERELLNIRGGDSGGGNSCSCDSCSCDCGPGDKTAPTGNYQSNSTSISSTNSSIIPPSST